MKFFRRATLGHTIIMGRKTFESLGCRPLPKRRNIVVTRNPTWNARGVEIAHSLEEAIQLGKHEARVFIIGGGELYRAALPIADEVFITEIADQNRNLNLFPAFAGDTYFPELDEGIWRLAREGKRWLIASDRVPPIRPPKLRRTGLYFRIQKYKRRRNKSTETQACATQST
jgi:dihydrofolate reductase